MEELVRENQEQRIVISDLQAQVRALLEKMEREELDAIKARVCKRPSSRDLLGKAVYEKDLQA